MTAKYQSIGMNEVLASKHTPIIVTGIFALIFVVHFFSFLDARKESEMITHAVNHWLRITGKIKNIDFEQQGMRLPRLFLVADVEYAADGIHYMVKSGRFDIGVWEARGNLSIDDTIDVYVKNPGSSDYYVAPLLTIEGNDQAIADFYHISWALGIAVAITHLGCYVYRKRVSEG